MNSDAAQPEDFAHRKDLDYARGAVVGGVVVDRRKLADGSTSLVITIQRYAPLFRVGVTMISIGAIVASASVASRFLVSRPFTLAESLWIVGAMVGLGWLISGAKLTLDSFRSRTIEIRRGGVSILLRGERAVAKVDLPTGSVADVLIVAPIGLVRLLFPSARRVHAALLSGERVEFHLGTSHEAKFLRQVVVEELRLPAEQWVDAGIPAFPRFSRLKIRMDARGMELQQPARGTWFLLLLTIVLSLAMPFIVAWITTLGGRSWHNVWERDTTPLLSGVGTLLIGLMLCAIAYHFRRSATVSVNRQSLVLNEMHPIRPALTEWAIPQVASFALQRRASGSWSIDIIFTDGAPSAPVLERLRARDAKHAFESLNVGLNRARGGK